MPSRQRKHGGGKFKSESQRKMLWAVAPSIAKRWAHNVSAAKSPAWAKVRSSVRAKVSPSASTFKGKSPGKKRTTRARGKGGATTTKRAPRARRTRPKRKGRR